MNESTAQPACPPTCLCPGDRPQLFVDDLVLQDLQGGQLRLHHPQPREVALELDRPWEGDACNFVTVFRDGGRFRMYYRGARFNERYRVDGAVFACASSDDGIHWRRDPVGLHEHQGSRDNNIVWTGRDGYAHDFSPFRDENPSADASARYKTVNRGRDPNALYAWQSPDGLNWSLAHPTPVVTGMLLDTQNIAFWDARIGRYRAYLRDFRSRDIPSNDEKNGQWRDIRTTTSEDFIHWEPPVWLQYAPHDEPVQMYTNQVLPYGRDPGLYIGLPARYVDRGWTASHDLLPGVEGRRRRAAIRPRLGSALTDTLIMFSRDGRRFHRWPQAFLPPQPGQWSYGDNYVAWQLLQTSEHELSLYATENYMSGGATRLRRFALRVDGFVSVHAEAQACQATTRPLRCESEHLRLNFATSAAGYVRLQVLLAEGEPDVPLADSGLLLGDQVDAPLHLPALRSLLGKAIRLRFHLLEADLFSFHFHGLCASTSPGASS